MHLNCEVRAHASARVNALTIQPSGHAMASVHPVSLPRVVIAQQVILKYRANDVHVTRRTNRLRCRRAERKVLLILLAGILIQLFVSLVRTICFCVSTLKQQSVTRA